MHHPARCVLVGGSGGRDDLRRIGNDNSFWERQANWCVGRRCKSSAAGAAGGKFPADPVCGGSLRQNSIAAVNRLAQEARGCGRLQLGRLRLGQLQLEHRNPCDAVPRLPPDLCHADEGYGTLAGEPRD